MGKYSVRIKDSYGVFTLPQLSDISKGWLRCVIPHVKSLKQMTEFDQRSDTPWPSAIDTGCGNHAAAVSLAAKLRGIPAYIVIPKNAPKCKVENVKRYDGHVIWSKPTMQSRESTAAKVQDETGALLVHPFNDGRIISGQGTIALELLEQVPMVDTIVVPISGGGLISGVALAAKAMNPSIRILAAEPTGADDVAQSKAAGKIVTLAQTHTIADGLRAHLGDLTCSIYVISFLFIKIDPEKYEPSMKTRPIVRDLVDEVITVEEGEIVEAMRMCYEILKVAVEPSGAVGLAAVLSQQFREMPTLNQCKNIVIVLSGGNVDLEIIWKSLSLQS
ncbi:hypothetical protein AMTR_s00009p00255960 [Amborella trichopoda]|uniref:Tryptophan synthase beta chain-like PALP domain-containing protein n=1 Tax=Amborella trichopoda TaxID=13333 RepID=W1NIU3_AMBTC|nr:hypothetical protein AMTR_s00009p00255960 [Amborella trichopoda]